MIVILRGFECLSNSANVKLFIDSIHLTNGVYLDRTVHDINLMLIDIVVDKLVTSLRSYWERRIEKKKILNILDRIQVSHCF